MLLNALEQVHFEEQELGPYGDLGPQCIGEGGGCLLGWECVQFGGAESGHPETRPVTKALMGACGWPEGEWVYCGGRAFTQTAAAGPWAIEAGPCDLPAGGL